MKLVSLMAAVDAASCHGLLLLLSVHYYNTIPCTYYSVFSPQSATDVPNIFFYDCPAPKRNQFHDEGGQSVKIIWIYH